MRKTIDTWLQDNYRFQDYHNQESWDALVDRAIGVYAQQGKLVLQAEQTIEGERIEFNGLD